MDGVVFVVVIFGLMAAILVWILRRAKRRTKAMAAVASDLALDFAEDEDAEGPDLKSIRIFGVTSLAPKWGLTNLMHGTVDNVSILVFDCYSRNAGAHNHSTVARFKTQDLHLPRFLLRPTGAHGRLAAIGMSDMPDIDIPASEEFSECYVLKSGDDAAVRQVFTDEVIRSVEPVGGLWLEGADDQLIVYRYNKEVEPHGIPAFVEEAFGVLSGFTGKAISGWEPARPE